MNKASKQGNFGHALGTVFRIKPVLPAFAVLALLAALSYSLRAIVTKGSPNHLPLALIMALQSIFLVPVLGLMARKQKVSLAFAPKLGSMYALRSLFGALTILVLYYTLHFLPAGLASTLAYSTPLFTALLAPLFLGEAATGLMLLLTIVGFAGVAVNALPYLHDVSLGIVGLGLLGAFFGSMLQIYMRKLAVTGEPALRGVFWMHAMTGVVAVAYCIVSGQWQFTMHDMFVTFAMAALTCGGQLGTAMAYQRGKALTVNALSFMTLPMTVLLAFVLLQEHISLLSLCGIALTLPACFGLIWAEQLRVKARHNAANHALTVADVREEHTAVQNAVGAQVEPLYTTEPTEAELLEDRRLSGRRNVTEHQENMCNRPDCDCLTAAA